MPGGPEEHDVVAGVDIDRPVVPGLQPLGQPVQRNRPLAKLRARRAPLRAASCVLLLQPVRASSSPVLTRPAPAPTTHSVVALRSGRGGWRALEPASLVPPDHHRPVPTDRGSVVLVALADANRTAAEARAKLLHPVVRAEQPRDHLLVGGQ